MIDFFSYGINRKYISYLFIFQLAKLSIVKKSTICESVKITVCQMGIFLNPPKHTLDCNKCCEYYETIYNLLIQIVGHYFIKLN